MKNKQEKTSNVNHLKDGEDIKIAPIDIDKRNEKEAQQKIKLFLENNKKKFSEFCDKFEIYRRNYKENKSINEEEFKTYSHKFNETMDTFLEEITDLPESNDIGKLLLEMLTYMQVAQAKNTRIHIRLHRNKMEQTDTENKKIKNNLKNIYTGFISIIGVFLGIFTLISININFFGNIVKPENSIKKIIYLFILVNMMSIISLITLIGLIYITICLFTDKEVKYKWLNISLIPFLVLLLTTLLIA
ncbi:hypothetical protein [Fusobacterium canifelinum]|uniref:Uncharacterized protein n=1 Tax=Fusobacterium canifelinum TaxID=285729 RepID=A0A3P1UJD8_9FUSO|nr:hypothetical protein [Fusobacterium canifelinum]RRD21678.1 hypothetical protein EII27_10565 [Fusobacterium canifelinum]